MYNNSNSNNSNSIYILNWLLLKQHNRLKAIISNLFRHAYLFIIY